MCIRNLFGQSPNTINAIFNPLLRHSYSCDASYYRLVPKAVLKPCNLNEIANIFKLCASNKLHLTFRAAGTSLNGQALSDCLLLDISEGWKNVDILASGDSVSVQPGIIASRVNEILKPFGRKIGPDPASINACLMGGIAANNSSGICSGIAQNPYYTLMNMKFILPNGLFINTADKDSNRLLFNSTPEIARGILEIKKEIESDITLKNKIINKYKIKNTIGYSLNSFTDYSEPADILSHLLIGSEGTLGFISEATYSTCPDYHYKTTFLIFFENLEKACNSVHLLKESGTAAVELMDNISLKSVSHLSEAPSIIRELPQDVAALLVEYQSSSQESLSDKESAFEKLSHSLNLKFPVIKSSTPKEQAKIWKLRKGLLASLAALRDERTAVIIEDLAFPLDCFSEAVLFIRSLFDRYGYKNAGLFGHATDGNIHAIFGQSFNSNDEVLKYDIMNREIADAVVNRFHGSLKAEHGTGRSMAPYVELEWGSKAFNIMRKIKKLIDPDNILNPDVIISANTSIHLQNIKQIPVIDKAIDACMECGFCEPSCPSKNITLTPRKRIILLREIERLKESDKLLVESFRNDYTYYSVETCAADGLCGLSCPVGINTGEKIKQIRATLNSAFSIKTACFFSNHLSSVSNAIKFLINCGHVIEKAVPPEKINKIIHFLEKLTGSRLPKWNSFTGKPSPLPVTDLSEYDAVYFPSCLSRLTGTPKNVEFKSITRLLIEISDIAGLKLHIPNGIENYCCGMPFFSKGYVEAGSRILNETVKFLWVSSKKGTLPVVLDSSSCAYSLVSSGRFVNPDLKEKYERLKFFDSIDFVYEYILPRLHLVQTDKKVILHLTCSGTKLGNNDKLLEIARKCSSDVIIPVNNSCCAFAGDRGMLFPELTESACGNEAEEVLKHNTDAYYSSNIPCETGMSTATNKNYISYLYLIQNSINLYNRKGAGVV